MVGGGKAGGVAVALLTVTGLDTWPTLPAASNALTVSGYPPSASERVSKSYVYGALVKLVSSVVPSQNSTRRTPTLSLASARRVTIPLHSWPADGAVMVTVGAVLSPLWP